MKDTDLKAQMVQDRRYLHAHPEEGWCEFETTTILSNAFKNSA